MNMDMKRIKHNPLRMLAEAYLARSPRQDAYAHASLRVLQMLEAAPRLAGSQPECAVMSDKPRILIVGSEPTLAGLMAQAYHIQLVPGVTQVLETARRPDQRPDLILLDIMAPARKGLEICRQLKADEAAQSVPVVLIINGDSAEDEARAFEMGAADCIARPFRLNVVEARIRNQIRIKTRNDLLECYANQDGLTGLANRRRFDMALDAEWRRATRDRQLLSLMMVDVDCFKQFNDLYGHREGDRCLQQVAGTMVRLLTRPGDLLARYGGEEFAAILPGTDLEGAHWMGERLRTAVAELDIPLQRQDGARQVTVSIGCASMHPNTKLTCHSLLQAADDQLYQAKHAGRNCVR